MSNIDDDSVSFTYKDYKDRSKKKVAVLEGTEFLRRFAQHVLPHGFIRIRHYGILASKNKTIELNLAKKHFGQQKWEKVKYSWVEIAQEKLNYTPNYCPYCKTQTFITIGIIEPQRGPPKIIANA